MVEMFFNSGGVHKAESNSNRTILLSGPPSCGKTSLLFQYALNKLADNSDNNGYVVFLCNSRRFNDNPPFLSQGIETCSDVFKRIQIKYVDSDDDLTKYFAAFHLLDPFPLVVIVDDFADFFPQRECQQRYNSARGRDLAMVRVLALSHSAIVHANQTAPCELLLSDTHHGDSPRLLFIYKRWVSSIFTVQADGSGSFILRNSISFGEHETRKKRARYSIALQYLVLHGFIEDTQL